MVRTKANTACGTRIASEKAPRKNFGGSSSSIDLGSPSSKKDKFAGGNPVCKRPTPEWQKPISKFFIPRPAEGENEEGNSPPKRRLTSAEDGKENINPADDTATDAGSSNSSKVADKPAADKPGTSSSGSKENGCVMSVNDEISEDD